MGLSKLQEEILAKNDKKIVIMSSAASGKTKMLTEKARRLLKSGVNPRSIAVITYTNMAAEELRQRLGEDYKDGIFIGTVHSLANFFLLSNGIDTSKVIDDEKFDKLFKMVSDNSHCIKKIDYILLDEAQDSGKQQFEFLFEMINPDNFFVVGDLRQAIYQGFTDASPVFLKKLSHDPDVACYSLNENYRNGKTILNFAKHLIQPTGFIDDSVPMRAENGFVKEVNGSLSEIIGLIKRQKEYKNWAILARSNAQVWKIVGMLKDENIPFDTFKQGDLKKSELTEKMLRNTVKVLTIHSSKGLEFKNVAVVGMFYHNQAERCVNYVAATRAEDSLFWVGGWNKKKRFY